jgi:hypothetical protein
VAAEPRRIFALLLVELAITDLEAVGNPLDAVVAGHQHIELAGENQQSPEHLQLGLD